MDIPETLAPLHTLFMVVSFVLGCLVGSFCNVCAARWPAGESVIKPRSRCPRCMNPIAWYDNIPLFSWLMLGAKCRHCDKPISWQYPLVEALTGVLFLFVYLRFGIVLATPIYMLFCAALVVVTFQDLADWTIPNEITLPGIPIALVVALLGMIYPESMLRVTDPIDALIGIALGGGIIYGMDRITVVLLKKPGMGMGDVKLLAMLGGFLGWQGVLGILFAASIVGSIIGVALILLQRTSQGAGEEVAETDSDADASAKKDAHAEDSEEDFLPEGHYIPFGPYLALGALLFLFFGPEIIEHYFLPLTVVDPHTPITLP